MPVIEEFFCGGCGRFHKLEGSVVRPNGKRRCAGCERAVMALRPEGSRTRAHIYSQRAAWRRRVGFPD